MAEGVGRKPGKTAPTLGLFVVALALTLGPTAPAGATTPAFTAQEAAYPTTITGAQEGEVNAFEFTDGDQLR